MDISYTTEISPVVFFSPGIDCTAKVSHCSLLGRVFKFQPIKIKLFPLIYVGNKSVRKVDVKFTLYSLI